MLFLFSVVSLCSLVSISTAVNCDIAYACVGQKITDKHVFVDGYRSAFSASTSISTGSKHLWCMASFSCDSAAFLRSTFATNQFGCLGGFSCHNTTIETVNMTIECRGANSCSFSNITSSGNSLLLCTGDQSCANSYILSMERIEAFGAYSLYNSTIDSQYITQNNLSIYLSGHLSAYGATLICRANHVCDIYCNGYDSCNMLYIDCIGCCIVHNASNDTIVPITNHSAFIAMNDLLFNSATFMQNNDELCNTEVDAILMDDYVLKKSLFNVSVISKENAPICCRATGSCQYAENIESTHIVCDAEVACDSALINANNGTVFCSANAACFATTINNVFDLYCLGSYACRQYKKQNITVSHNIVCSGYMSCYYANIHSAGNLSIYFTGFESGKNSDIYCHETHSCSIICSAADACVGLTVVCDGYCFVEYKVPTSTPYDAAEITATDIHLNDNKTESMRSTPRSSSYSSTLGINDTSPPSLSILSTAIAVIISVISTLNVIGICFILYHRILKKHSDKNVNNAMNDIADDDEAKAVESDDEKKDDIQQKKERAQQYEDEGAVNDEIKDSDEDSHESLFESGVVITPETEGEHKNHDELMNTERAQDESGDLDDIYVKGVDASNESQKVHRNYIVDTEGKLASTKPRKHYKTDGNMFYDKYYDSIHKEEMNKHEK